MDRKKVDIESLLEHDETVKIQPQGYSMYPLFIPGRDWAVVKKAECNKLKKGDVILYRSFLYSKEGSILVLHRICKIKNDEFYTVGDNQRDVEGPLKKEQIKGVLVMIERNGKHISVDHPFYVLMSRMWLFLRPARPAISKTVARLKRLAKKKWR